MTTDPWPGLDQFITDLRFDEIAQAESRRVAYVPPASVDRVRSLIEQAGVDHLVTVKPHPWLPPHTWLLVDQQALDAECAKTMQHLRNQPRYPDRPWSDPPHPGQP